jgi:hypothetical protein
MPLHLIYLKQLFVYLYKFYILCFFIIFTMHSVYSFYFDQKCKIYFFYFNDIYIAITPTCFDTLNHPQGFPKWSVMWLRRDTSLERPQNDTHVSKHVWMIIIQIMLKLNIYICTVILFEIKTKYSYIHNLCDKVYLNKYVLYILNRVLFSQINKSSSWCTVVVCMYTYIFVCIYIYINRFIDTTVYFSHSCLFSVR